MKHFCHQNKSFTKSLQVFHWFVFILFMALGLPAQNKASAEVIPKIQQPVEQPKWLQPVPIVQPITETPAAPIAHLSSAYPSAPDSGGNAYPLGQCTQYVKSRRPDIPNNLGNADLWFDELKALGWPTGFVPKAGAIGQEIGHMHVIYVEAVNPDGSIYLSERNWDFNGSFRYRNAPAAEFEYIY